MVLVRPLPIIDGLLTAVGLLKIVLLRFEKVFLSSADFYWVKLGLRGSYSLVGGWKVFFDFSVNFEAF